MLPPSSWRITARDGIIRRPRRWGPRSGSPPFAADWTGTPARLSTAERAPGDARLGPRAPSRLMRAAARDRHPGRRSCGSTSASRSSGSATTRGASAAWRQAKRSQPDTPSGRPRGRPPPSRLAARPAAVRAERSPAADTRACERLLVRGVAPAARAGARSRRSGSSRARPARAPRRSRGAGRGRRRPLRQGRSRPRVLPPRPARAPLPARADGSLPPRTALDLARRLRPGAQRTAPRPCAKPEIHLWKGSAATR